LDEDLHAQAHTTLQKQMILDDLQDHRYKRALDAGESK
jgi:hypothetical protein